MNDQQNLFPSSFRRDEPYNDLPPLPPRADVETKAVLKMVAKARVALAELKVAGRQIPNQALLLRSIALQEAKFSSEIENIVTTNDELYQAVGPEALDSSPAAKEVLRYREALWHGYQHLLEGGVLSPPLFCELATIIKSTQIGVRTLPGTRISNPLTGSIIYSPPEDDARIRDLLQNLCEFMYSDADLDPLIKLAITHYQFEAIHPFPDGNGRTGRVLNILFLIDQGLLEFPVLYLSRTMLQTRSDYYRGLAEVTENQAWEQWILYILEAILETSTQTTRTIEGILEAMQDASARIRAETPRIYSRELVEVLFSQPYVRLRYLEQEGIAKRQTASRYLKTLEEIGLLESLRVWRETIYVNPRLLSLLAGE